MKNKSRFLELCGDHFSFLRNNFAFGEEKSQQYSWGEKFSMKNETTGVIVTQEFQECNVLARVYKLVEGAFIESQGEITPETQLFSFDLADIVMLRAPEKVMTATTSEEKKTQRPPLDLLVAQQAYDLQNYASDLLLGDFSLFRELDRVVKERAREAAFQKWGDAAAKYGWKK
jgi:DNA replication initiation complex subunit (GINS family)